ncbi:MAG: thioredoxin [Candidatus Bathyarchaeota archaeon]|nr:thioredoxin [Candidatus Bathyarchaeota archaeon]
MEEDVELERIRQRKLREMKKKTEDGPAVPIADSPIEVTDSNFNEIVKKDGLVVVDCWAAWCAPCRMIAPVIEELAKDYVGKILFGKLNVDSNRRVPLEYQIMSIPTVLVFKDGVLVDRILGAMPRRLLEQKLTQHL